MQNTAKQTNTPLRTFNVGVVGASKEAFGALSRIFGVTRYRTRSYKAVPIIANSRTLSDDIDFVILCTNNPNIIKHWSSGRIAGQAMTRPLIRVARQNSQNSGYVITVPVNPSRLLRQLDQFTIKELNFFPEFQIGGDSSEFNESAMENLKELKGDKRYSKKRHGLQRALVVDDSMPVRRQIELEFELLDVEVDSADSAETAIESAKHTAYDIIFMDVVMPGMDGYAACKRVKRSPLNRGTPIVLLTSRSSSFDKIKGTLAGCDSYLVKPISHNDFENVVNKYFSEIRTVSK